MIKDNVRIDLIYEGIATFCFNSSAASFQSIQVRIDLIYEGIATHNQHCAGCSYMPICPNWPDLRRDCDQISSSFSLQVFLDKVRIDLIYEGIATR